MNVLLSHPWNPNSLVSQVWTVAELRDLGRMCRQRSPPCTCSTSFPGDGTTTYTSRWAVLQLSQAECTQRPADLPAGRALKSHQVSKSSDCGFRPAASFLGIPPPTKDSTFGTAVWAGVGISLGAEG